MNENLEPILWGGIGEKLSNSNTQWYQQNRIYKTDTTAMALCYGLDSYWYLVDEDKDRQRRSMDKPSN